MSDPSLEARPGMFVGLPVGCDLIEGWCLLRRADEDHGTWFALPADRGPRAGRADLTVVDGDGERLVLRGGFGRWIPEAEFWCEVELGRDVDRERRVAALERIQRLLEDEPAVPWERDIDSDSEEYRDWVDEVLTPNDLQLDAWSVRRTYVLSLRAEEPPVLNISSASMRRVMVAALVRPLPDDTPPPRRVVCSEEQLEFEVDDEVAVARWLGPPDRAPVLLALAPGGHRDPAVWGPNGWSQRVFEFPGAKLRMVLGEAPDYAEIVLVR